MKKRKSLRRHNHIGIFRRQKGGDKSEKTRKSEKTGKPFRYCFIVIGLLLLLAIHFIGEPYPNYRTLISAFVKAYVWLIVVFNFGYLIIRKRNK